MHGGGSSGSGSQKKARIEIIPLIDVIMFLLATFVLFTLSMQKTEGMPVTLPEAVTADDREVTKDSATITINNNAEIFWGKTAVTWDNFILNLLAFKGECDSKQIEPIIFINFDETASFGSAMSVMDEIRKATINKVRVETRFIANKS